LNASISTGANGCVWSKSTKLTWVPDWSVTVCVTFAEGFEQVTMMR
jgi:hypothetical protein